MPSWDTVQGWATALIKAVSVILSNPAFLSLLIMGWILGAIFWRAWFKRQITNANSAATTQKISADWWKENYDLEKKQHDGLKNSLAQNQDRTSVTAREVASGTNEVRAIVGALAKGEKLVTLVNPLDDPANWRVAVPFSDLKKYAAIAYANNSGLGVTTSSLLNAAFVTTGTATAATVDGLVAKLLIEIMARKEPEQK